MKPLNDWILVALEPLPTQVGSIILPSGGHVYKAKVLAVGSGKPTEYGRNPVDLSPGDRVAFLRWHAEHQQGKQIRHTLDGHGEKDLLLIKPEDVLLVLEEGDPHLST